MPREEFREVLHVCPDHGPTSREDPDLSCCKKGRSVASIQRLNGLGLPNTHMVSDLADALLQVVYSEGLDALAGQAALDEANNRFVELEHENARLREAVGYQESAEEDPHLRDLYMLRFHLGTAQGYAIRLQRQTVDEATLQHEYLETIGRLIDEVGYPLVIRLQADHEAGRFPWKEQA